MSELGGVVLLGRGGNFILGPKRGFHVRFVAPHETRVANLMKYREMTRKEAEGLISESDGMRGQLIRKLFRADIDDPVYYDLMVNSAYVDIEDLLGVVKAAVMAKFTKLAHLRPQAIA
jgi:cytidylate kinase